MRSFVAVLFMLMLAPGLALGANPLDEDAGELPEGAGVEWFYGKWNPYSTNSQITSGIMTVEKGWIHYEKSPFSSQIRLILIDKNGAVFLRRYNMEKFNYFYTFLYLIPWRDGASMLLATCKGWDAQEITDALWNSSDEEVKAFWDSHERCNPRHDKTGGKYPLGYWSQQWHTDAKWEKRPLR